MSLTLHTHHLERISAREINQLAQLIAPDRDSVTMFSLAAGPNREMMAEPSRRFIEALLNERPDLSAVLRVGIDDIELQKAGLSSDRVAEFPPFIKLAEKYSQAHLRIKASEQPEGNSVLECVEAMREAERSAVTQSICFPRDNRFLVNRISLGLGHYGPGLGTEYVRDSWVIGLPSDPQFETRGRNISEGLSYLASRILKVWPSQYEAFTERRGVFRLISQIAHKAKVAFAQKALDSSN